MRAALFGNQNSGKTTLFNYLTGSGEYVGNRAGVTVEPKKKLSEKYGAVITDLPGVYSLSPYTAEEVAARKSLFDNPPDVIIDVIDSTNIERSLNLAIQLSDTGISPGSGVGNHRYEISENTLGVPVVSIGIPTVVSTEIISGKETGEPMFVTPREIDRVIDLGAKLIGMSINICLQKNISQQDLFSLVG